MGASQSNSRGKSQSNAPVVMRHQVLARGWPLLPCRKGGGRVLRTLVPVNESPGGLPVLCPRRESKTGESAPPDQLPEHVIACLTAVGVAVIDVDLLDGPNHDGVM